MILKKHAFLPEDDEKSLAILKNIPSRQSFKILELAYLINSDPLVTISSAIEKINERMERISQKAVELLLRDLVHLKILRDIRLGLPSGLNIKKVYYNKLSGVSIEKIGMKEIKDILPHPIKWCLEEFQKNSLELQDIRELPEIFGDSWHHVLSLYYMIRKEEMRSVTLKTLINKYQEVIGDKDNKKTIKKKLQKRIIPYLLRCKLLTATSSENRLIDDDITFSLGDFDFTAVNVKLEIIRNKKNIVLPPFPSDFQEFSSRALIKHATEEQMQQFYRVKPKVRELILKIAYLAEKENVTIIDPKTLHYALKVPLDTISRALKFLTEVKMLKKYPLPISANYFGGSPVIYRLSRLGEPTLEELKSYIEPEVYHHLMKFTTITGISYYLLREQLKDYWYAAVKIFNYMIAKKNNKNQSLFDRNQIAKNLSLSPTSTRIALDYLSKINLVTKKKVHRKPTIYQVKNHFNQEST